MTKQETVANILKKVEESWPESAKNISPAVLRIHRLHGYLQHELSQVLTKHSLQNADFGVLATLRRSGQPYCLSPTELYSSMLFSSGGLTKVLNRVTAAGLVERIDNPEDKRSKLVKLTETGKALIDKLVQELHLQEKQKLEALTQREQEQLNALLTKLLHAWE